MHAEVNTTVPYEPYFNKARRTTTVMRIPGIIDAFWNAHGSATMPPPTKQVNRLTNALSNGRPGGWWLPLSSGHHQQIIRCGYVPWVVMGAGRTGRHAGVFAH